MLDTVDPLEIEKFSAIAAEWWNPHGKFKPLHRINGLRVGYIRDKMIEHFGGQRSEIRDQKENTSSPTSDLRPLPPLTLLDIGCGGGLVAEPMAKLGAKVTAIDASEKNIAVARTHAAQTGMDIDYRCTTAEALLESGAHYDVVLALEIIEHVANPAAFVAACAGLVKPGGLLIFSTINRTPKAYALAIVGAEYILRWLPRGTHEFDKFVKPSEFAEWLKPTGFDIKELMGMVMNPLTFEWSLTPKDVSVNYLLVAGKP